MLRIITSPKFDKNGLTFIKRPDSPVESYPISESVLLAENFLRGVSGIDKLKTVSIILSKEDAELRLFLDSNPTNCDISSVLSSCYGGIDCEIDEKEFLIPNNMVFYGIPDISAYLGESAILPLEYILRSLIAMEDDLIIKIELEKVDLNTIGESIDEISKLIAKFSYVMKIQKNKSGTRILGGVGGTREVIIKAFEDIVYDMKKIHSSYNDIRQESGWLCKIKASQAITSIYQIVWSSLPRNAGSSINTIFLPSRERNDKLEKYGQSLRKAYKLDKRTDFGEDLNNYIDNAINVLKKAYNIATHDEASVLFALPRFEVPGYSLKSEADFGANVPSGDLKIGKIFSKGSCSQSDIAVPKDNLTRHLFITGVTGAGKTYAMKKILVKLAHKTIPYLVIEPAKSEYRILDPKPAFVLSPGKSSEISLYINPLEIPYGFPMQTHVDLIKAVFNASFPMYGPMPYILERAIYRAYARWGWDLSTEKNRFIGNVSGDEYKLKRQEYMPNLYHILETLDDVVQEIGYSKDLTQDVRGALKVRLMSLLTGTKEGLFSGANPNNLDSFLNAPTVIELENIGDDEEKIFLMGLIIIGLYQIRRVGGPKNNLIHLSVFEEAHRLLSETRRNNSSEFADVRGKAIETFNSLLSEIRSYGQGIAVLDQIPSKLSRDIIKNTGTKIIFRLYDKEDRELVGDCLGLDEDQINHLLHLECGNAIYLTDNEMYNAAKIMICD